ncbi:MAG: histidinol-phosphate transaminase [Synergistaceae bacterium]|jgi:histidinol-phosphate aminotransferase|nr:histidinol-phosphate transaminase [Synergistaceae bacterium]
MNAEKIDVAALVRSDLRNMENYSVPFRRGRYKLDSNESPFGLPDALRRRLSAWLEDTKNLNGDLNLYPDSENTRLRETLAKFWKVGPENVTCGVGSDQLIDGICRVFLEPGDVVVVPKPTFGMYAISARLNHGEVREVPIPVNDSENSDAGSSALADELVRAAAETRAKILFLCSPNNPTGQSLTEEQLCTVAENARCVVVVDEAYGEFAESTMIPRVGEYPNMIVLRTFSKAFALAGARVGYAVASAGTIDALGLVKPPFNLPTLSQLLATWAVEEAQEYASRVAYLNERREELYRELKKIPWLTVSRSDANFLFVRSERDIAALLEEKGIFVRACAGTSEFHNARITVGTAEQNGKVVETLCGAGPM